MWQIDKIKATNLFSFKKLSYTMQQGITTLVYGNNEDSDNQGSNGSGKSSLNEAIAIALMGSPLRKCTSSEIINDDADECQVQLWMKNHALNQELYIGRKFFRKDSSVCVVQTWFNGEEKDIKLSGVNEYNKFIIDTLGISKDDLLNYVILSKYTYKNFLSASDKEKKDIINSFSGGNKVDEAIELLNNDKREFELDKSEKKSVVDSLSGKVSALSEQIENEAASKEDRAKQTKLKIDETKEDISNTRKRVRELSSVVSEKLEELNRAKTKTDEFSEFESKVKDEEDVDVVINEITSFGNDVGVGCSGIAAKIDEVYESISEKEKLHAGILKQIENDSSKLTEMSKELEYVIEDAEKDDANIEKQKSSLAKSLSDVNNIVKALNTERRALQEEIENLRVHATKLQSQIKGAVKCPKCSHEFLLDPSADLDKVKAEFDESVKNGVEKKSKYTELEQTIIGKKDDIDRIQADQLKLPARSKIHNQISEIKGKIQDLSSAISRAKVRASSLQSEIDDCDKKVIKIIDGEVDRIGDKVDQLLSGAQRSHRNAERDHESSVSDLSVLEARLSQLEAVTQEDTQTSLKVSLKQYKEQLGDAEIDLLNAEKIVNKLIEQEQVYIQYKTHLANSKIEALSQVTNSFLEDIGSELRVQFVGFKVLKSGKVRDKITVNLLRNGEEVGSYGKLSVGEQGRINLACILAMNKLVNMNCEANKGMNLLVLDEILDGIDESGLNSILDTLNNTGLTCLVVSHGKTSESYPHTTTITKKHGESIITA
ncbi:MAG: hypothetical protein ACRDD8_04890 [Bacteroidales bacterium]